MTLAAANVTFGPGGPAIAPAGDLPLAALLVGRPVAEVADLLPRIFNLCAAAQASAARLCLGLPDTADPLAPGAFENSAAGRQSAHSLLRRIEATHGRGPLWRLAGLLADLDAAERGHLPPARLKDGTATAPAARGTYALRLTHAGGLLTGIARRTPTDHLLAPGGALLQAIANLPPALFHLAPQVIALHDPCIPVILRPGASHATAPQVQHA